MRLLKNAPNFLRRLAGTHWHGLLLGLIVLLAFALRIWGIGFGLPYIYHFDEHFYVNTALKLGAGIINNPPYLPTGFSNLLFGEYAAYFVVGKISGIFISTQEFEAAFRGDPTSFYVFGRLTSVLLGTLTALTTYQFGKSFQDPIMGLIAAGFVATSFLHVRDSHYAVPDVAATFFVTLSITLAMVGMRSEKRKHIYLSAIAGGFAVAIKWTALPVAFAVGWASLWIGYDNAASYGGRLMSRMSMFTIIFFVLGFALGSPQLIVNPAPYIDQAMMQSRAGKLGGYENWQVDSLLGWLFYGKVLLSGMGPFLLTLGVIGLVRRLVLTMKTSNKAGVLLFLFPLTYYLFMGSTRHYFLRYSQPLVPFIALFAAEIVVVVLTWAATRAQRTLVAALAIVLITGAIAEPLVKSIRHGMLLDREDTRTMAKRWIETHIPAESRIAVDWETHGPPLDTQDNTVPYSRRAYDVTEIGHTGLSDHSVDWYHEQGYDYLISSSFISDLTLVSKAKDAERQAFYLSLDQDLTLIQEFWPYKNRLEPPFIFDEIYGPMLSLWHRERPGPVIKIYKLD